MNQTQQDRIIILDFGSQYTQLIARRIREIGVYCEIYPHDVAEQRIRDAAPKGLILSGGPLSLTQRHAPRAPDFAFSLGVPVLGICYGMQAMAMHFGGEVAGDGHSEFGYAELRVHGDSRLLRGMRDRRDSAGHSLLDVWMSHGDSVSALPADFTGIASTENAPIAAISCEQRRFYGLQFHPEVTHTTQGTAIYRRFVCDICGCRTSWTSDNIAAQKIAQIRQQVGTEQVILGLSGGVDSAVAAALLHRAIGAQLTCVFVDNGLLRLHEAEQVMSTFSTHMGIKVIHVDAEERFLSALVGVADPERKRMIIGEKFIEIFEEQAARLPRAQWLAQGTIYPDVIESAASGSGKANLIKSHHNVGGLPAAMRLKLVEPLRDLFKDEVRQLGAELGLAAGMIYRHPFPGPGLGVRILGEVKKTYADLLRLADAILIDELRTAGLYEQVSQAFAVFLPVKSVGVTGDGRNYNYVIALRAVETSDFMTARWAHLPYDFLDLVSRRIINEVKGVSRVVYDVSGKPPATIEWE